MKKTRVNQLEITAAGHVQVRIQKYVDIDGDIVDMGWHRTIVEVDGDVDAQMEATNVHLRALGFSGVSSAEVAQIKAHFELVATQEKITAYAEEKRRAREELGIQP